MLNVSKAVIRKSIRAQVVPLVVVLAVWVGGAFVLRGIEETHLESQVLLLVVIFAGFAAGVWAMPAHMRRHKTMRGQWGQEIDRG